MDSSKYLRQINQKYYNYNYVAKEWVFTWEEVAYQALDTEFQCYSNVLEPKRHSDNPETTLNWSQNAASLLRYNHILRKANQK